MISKEDNNEQIISNDCEAEFKEDPVKRNFRNLIVVFLCLLSSILTIYYLNNPYGSYLPIILIGIFEWYRSYPRQKRSYYGLIRLILYILIISLWNVFLLKLFIHLISYLIHCEFTFLKRIEHLYPYAFILTSFGRTKDEMNLKDKRRYIIHLLYDIPAFLLVLIFKLLNNPLNSLYSQISPYCYLGCLPLPRDVEQLHEIGIEYVINMCAEYNGPLKTYKKYEIKQFHFPTIDSTAPSKQTIDQAINIMKDLLKKKKKMFVHCKAGMGRSATIVFCHLVINENMLEEDALKLLKEKRPEITNSLIHYQPVRLFLSSRYQQNKL